MVLVWTDVLVKSEGSSRSQARCMVLVWIAERWFAQVDLSSPLASVIP